MGAVKGFTNFSITVTITDKTQGPFQLYALLTTGSSVTGATVAPSAGYAGLDPKCANFSVQDVSGIAGNLYGGDKNIANDGSRQGWQLQNGDTYSEPQATSASGGNSVDLRDHYVQTDTNSTKFNLNVRYV